MAYEAHSEEKYPAPILAELKNAAAQIMAAAMQLPEEHCTPLKAAAKIVFNLATELEESSSHRED